MQINSIQAMNPNRTSQSFGRIIEGEDFAEDVIKEAKRLLKENLAVNANNYKEGFMDCWEGAKVRPVERLFWPMAKFIELLGETDAVDNLRMSMGIATVGVSEIANLPEAGIRKFISNIKAKRFAKQVERCMLAIVRSRH